MSRIISNQKSWCWSRFLGVLGAIWEAVHRTACGRAFSQPADGEPADLERLEQAFQFKSIFSAEVIRLVDTKWDGEEKRLSAGSDSSKALDTSVDSDTEELFRITLWPLFLPQMNNHRLSPMEVLELQNSIQII